MQKFVTFIKKNLEIKFAKDKKYRKVTNHFHYTGEYRGSAASI